MSNDELTRMLSAIRNRPKRNSSINDELVMFISSGRSVEWCSEYFGVSQSTIYRRINKLKEKGEL